MPYKMKVFGEISTIESIPKALCGVFSVVGVNTQCQDSIIYTHAQLQAHRRVEKLVLINPTKVQTSLLNALASAGCKIYCLIQAKQVDWKAVRVLAKAGIVVISRI